MQSLQRMESVQIAQKEKATFFSRRLKKIVFDKLLAWYPSRASVAQGSGHESRHSTAP